MFRSTFGAYYFPQLLSLETVDRPTVGRKAAFEMLHPSRLKSITVRMALGRITTDDGRRQGGVVGSGDTKDQR